MKKAVILLSGGLDSATVLAMARAQGFDCYTLSFDYGQRAKAELNAAALLAEKFSVKRHLVQAMHLDSIGGSALTDTSIAVPEHETEGIPVTYVPARNTLFLAFALSWAEVLQSKDIFIGVNAVDFSGYPDCRQEFISAFEKTANLATKIGVEEGGIRIHTPLIDLTKAEIIQAGTSLGVDYALTISCYQAIDSGAACGRCDSCRLRKQGFVEADLADPTLYQ